MLSRLFFAWIVVASVFCFEPALAQISSDADTFGSCREIKPTTLTAATVGRRALVIGNAAYSNGIPSLKNPLNDAQAVSEVLGKLGFTVHLATNAEGTAINDCVSKLKASIAKGDTVLIYYSGHGIQIDDRNYIVAADAGTEGNIEKGFVYIDDIIDGVKQTAGAVLVFLDACRNNPFAPEGAQGLSVSTGRGIERGLKPVDTDAKARQQAHGIFVAYSTSPNSVASDGDGDLSPFTEAFVKSIAIPGYSVQRALSEVTNSVGKATDWSQTPWTKSSLTSEIKLGGGLTLEEAISISENFAARSNQLLLTGDVGGAIEEALKGLPAMVTPTAEKTFALAYAALGAATRSSSIRLPSQAEDGASVAANKESERAAVVPSTANAEIEVWDTRQRKLISKVKRSRTTGEVLRSPLFSANGASLILHTGKNELTLLNALTGAEIRKISIPLHHSYSSINFYAFSPDGSKIILATSMNEPHPPIQVWDIASGNATFELDIQRLKRSVGQAKGWPAFMGFAGLDTSSTMLTFLSFVPGDQSTIVFGKIDMAHGTVIGSGEHKLKGASIYIESFGSRDDGDRIALSYFDAESYRIALLDVHAGTVINDRIKGFRATFSPDGSLLATLSPEVSIFSADTGVFISNFGQDSKYDYVPPAAYRDDGRMLGGYYATNNNFTAQPYDIWPRNDAGKSLVEASIDRLIRQRGDRPNLQPLDYSLIDEP